MRKLHNKIKKKKTLHVVFPKQASSMKTSISSIKGCA